MNKFASRKIIPLLSLWLFIASVWAAYRYFFRNPEWLDELVFKPIVFLVPVCWFLVKHGGLTAAALGFRRSAVSQIIKWGGGFGLFLVIENIFIWQLRGKYLQIDLGQILPLIQVLVISLGTAISEEILYRGFLLERIQKVVPQASLANFINAILFSLAHVTIAIMVFHYLGRELIAYLFVIFILGYAQGIIYQRSGSIYSSIFAHTLWNLSNIFIS